MYTVGQLSKKTGISVRTLHYYEELGLLKPDRSIDNQYRIYGSEDVMKLQQIAVLKSMGFRLREIKNLINRNIDQPSDGDYEVWVKVIENQILAIQKEKEELQHVENLLQSTLYAMKATRQVRIEDMEQFIQEMEQHNRKQHLRELFFTEEEMAKLPSNNPADPLIMEWANLIHEVQTHLNDPPDSPYSQHLAARIAKYGQELFKGDNELADKYWNFIMPDHNEYAKIYGMNKEVMDYIEQILEHYYSNDGKH